ncbi:SAG family member [Eimeria mitis]|uniref:SAG family member n=1 Tax=Eimeria mitis TaxID=44415 RepID=U6JRC9_9EIME|nr:SAG family member [Eimeria mitis]CDJ27366.1 SAG family member [Eimeria mitis]
MLALRLCTVVSAFLLFFYKVDGSDADEPQTPPVTTTITYAVKLGEDGTCLSEINAARKKAGFNDFVIPQAEAKDKRLPDKAEPDPQKYDEWVWKPVCAALIKEEAGEGKSDEVSKNFGSGTYAYHAVDDAERQADQEVETETEEGSALICMTTPDVLPAGNGTAPFTEEQWGRIVNAIENSASALLPGLLSLAAVALGLVATM